MPLYQSVIQIPFNHILSADARVCQTDYVDDQSWEVCLDPKAPFGLALETSYGLRARIAQVFPVILDANNLPFQDPKPQFQPLLILPNLIRYQIVLLQDIDVELTIWVPDSHTLAGELRLRGKMDEMKHIRAGVLMRFASMADTQGMSAQTIRGQLALSGTLDGLDINLSLAGLPSAIHRPHPGLMVEVDVLKDKDSSVRWILKSEKKGSASAADIKQKLKGNWQPLQKHLEVDQNNQQLWVHTGNPEWNALFQLGEIASRRLRFSHTSQMPFDTLVSSRQPDQGYSLRGDGSDYQRGWHGPDLWDIYGQLNNYLLPGQVDFATGMLQNFIQLQQGYGNVDLRPGLGGQRARLLAPPLLATCVKDVLACGENHDFLVSAFPVLGFLLTKWFDGEHDRDQDGLPEWSHPFQTGWESNPLLDRWQPESRGYLPDVMETPMMGALLVQELKSMIYLAQLLGRHQEESQYQQQLELTSQQVEAFWDKRRKVYSLRDRDTHLTSKSITLSHGNGSGTFSLDRTFEKPVRAQIELFSANEVGKRVDLQLSGTTVSGDHAVERFAGPQVHWSGGKGVVTSIHAYVKVDAISVGGMENKDSWKLTSVDLTQLDITNFLPLWAGIPSAERAAQLIEQSLIPDWLQPFNAGIPYLLPGLNGQTGNPDQQRVSIPLASMVGEGLVRYGYDKQAGLLVNGLMEAIIKNVHHTGCLAENLDAETGKPAGDANHLNGLPPLGLFLSSLGIKLYHAGKICVWGENPYPWDVELFYKGTRVERLAREVIITFRDGKRTRVEGSEKRMITWQPREGAV